MRPLLLCSLLVLGACSSGSQPVSDADFLLECGYPKPERGDAVLKIDDANKVERTVADVRRISGKISVHLHTGYDWGQMVYCLKISPLTA